MNTTRRITRPLVCLKNASFILALTAAVVGVAAGAEPGPKQPPGQNIALGKPYTLSPLPGYRYCTDPDDKSQLTDGKLTEGYFWTQKGTVGWSNAKYVTVTVDLGNVEPICGVSFRTAAGAAGVCWPSVIRLMVSDDGNKYRDVGDLVELDHAAAGPWPKDYAVRRLVTSKLQTRGRFLRFMILPSGPYFFTDEVQVFRGPAELLARDPGGKLVGDPNALFAEWSIRAGVRRRFEADVAGLRQAIGDARLTDESIRKQLLDRLADAERALAASPIPPHQSFRAVLPFGDAHAALFCIQADLWRSLGRGPLTVSVPPTWNPSALFAPPPDSSFGGIEVHAMRGEYRAAAVNLANSTDRPIPLRVRFDGLPGSPSPGYVTVHDVPWTDTVQGRPVAAALPEARRSGQQWLVKVLPGLTGQVWLTFHVIDLPAGEHAGAIVLDSDGVDPVRVPVRLHVYPMQFPKHTTLHVGGWTYTDRHTSYGVTPQNRKAFLEHMRSHFVNTPWATASVLMQFKFAADGTVELDTHRFDNWIAQWPNAKRYMVFLAIGDYSGSHTASFAGAEMGTPEFNRHIGAWISAWVRHLDTKGIAPEQLGLLIHDEPHEGTNVEPLVAWAKAIRAAEPKVLIWEDPTYHNPAKAPPELFEVCDIICPNRPMWLRGGKPFAEFYLAQKAAGRTLQSYSCSGPARLLDPYSYYRLQAWHCWNIGGTGSFFWAFGDNSGASSWNEYQVRSGPYTPLFIDDDTIVAGKQMEAVRESVEDYETFVMLRQAVEKAKAAGRADAAVAEAETLLKTAAAEVLAAPNADQLDLHAPKDRTKADTLRVRLLKSLASLQ